jgi:hypothetical protein
MSEPRPSDSVLWRVTGQKFVASFVSIDQVIVEAAPYLAKILDMKPGSGRWLKPSLEKLRRVGTVECLGVVP